jgi:hypothetical protein
LNHDDLEFGHGLNLTSDDLQAIGAVLATWAYAEWWLMMTLNFISDSITPHPVSQRRKPPHGVQEWIEWWRQLYPVAFAGRQMHIQISEFLIQRGIELSKRRNMVSHWLFIRNDLGMEVSDSKSHERLEISTEYLQLLASDINRWRADIMRLQCNISSDKYDVPYLTRIPPLYSRTEI